jgi:hypothetical protein
MRDSGHNEAWKEALRQPAVYGELRLFSREAITLFENWRGGRGCIFHPVVFSPRQTAEGLVYTDSKMLPPPAEYPPRTH